MSCFVFKQFSREMKELQEKMSRLFTKQKAAGGIIDVEAEARKYLIITSSGDVESVDHQPGPPVRPPPAPPKPAATESSKKCKGGSGLGKKRDYGEKKRVTRWVALSTNFPEKAFVEITLQFRRRN
jgi:hypothetical protein